MKYLWLVIGLMIFPVVACAGQVEASSPNPRLASAQAFASALALAPQGARNAHAARAGLGGFGGWSLRPDARWKPGAGDTAGLGPAAVVIWMRLYLATTRACKGHPAGDVPGWKSYGRSVPPWMRILTPATVGLKRWRLPAAASTRSCIPSSGAEPATAMRLPVA